MSAAAQSEPGDEARRAGAPRRSAARLAAVQALYQIELSGDSAEDVLVQVLRRPEGDAIDAPEGATAVRPRTELLTQIVHGVRARRVEIDDMLVAVLSEQWPLARVELVLRCILRAGAYELVARPDVPARVVIDEYVDLAHAFYAGPEPGMINGVLDRVARGLRPDELEPEDSDGGAGARPPTSG